MSSPLSPCEIRVPRRRRSQRTGERVARCRATKRRSEPSRTRLRRRIPDEIKAAWRNVQSRLSLLGAALTRACTLRFADFLAGRLVGLVRATGRRAIHLGALRARLAVPYELACARTPAASRASAARASAAGRAGANACRWET